jgi:hypothetical protein
MAVMGTRLYGVVTRPDRQGATLAPQTSVIAVRDLGAIVRQAPYAPVDRSPAEIGEYRRVVETVFEQAAILPAPFGVVFRSGEHVATWLQMHHLALTEGMHLVEGRCEARVHLAPRDGAEADEDDLAGAAAEVFRALRRDAAAVVPLRRAGARPSASSAFLVDRAQWDEFGELVAAQARRYDELRLHQTGPWPPYDFVRMDLGA